MDVVGRRGSNLLLSSDGMAVIIDESTNSVISSGTVEALMASGSYDAVDNRTVSTAVIELASAALTSLEIRVLSNSDRMHTIPKSVVAEAKRALEWRSKHNRGGTPVGLNTARTLAGGGQIGIKKIRHIAKYFPRHEVDKKGKGYSPSEEGYPSRGRIAWGLWGGDAARKWASAIVEREDKKSVTATGAYDFKASERFDLEGFKAVSADFAVRVDAETGMIDRLYQVSSDGRVAVWDDGSWDEMGNIENDFDTYDKSLDDPYGTSDKIHIPIDCDSAVVVAAMMDGSPFEAVDPRNVNEYESDMVFSAIQDPKWDAAIIAAVDSDGKYTPEERSAKAKKQFRDRGGKFGQAGSRVQVGSNPTARGVLEKVDPNTGKASVKMDSGETVEVDVKDTEQEKDLPALPSPTSKEIDTSGILGQTKEKKNKYKARLATRMQPLSPEEVKGFLADFPDYVEKKRAENRKAAPVVSAAEPAAAPAPAPAPSTAADKEMSEDFEEPSQSDVEPIYMAIVANDDPQAVMELIALVPAGSKSNSAAVFRRAGGKWEKDEAILADLNSPTPPPVVVLDLTTLEDVITQVDSAVTAAGGPDRNRGNAEKLRKYWLTGEGAAKIRWNSPGGWTRCVRNLSKYMGTQAKGYCALRHKEATGMWPGSHSNRQKYAFNAYGNLSYSDDLLLPEESIVAASIMRAKAQDARKRVLTAGGSVEVGGGSGFMIPLVIPEGVESGDGRIFDKGAITIRDLPLPLLWQIKTADGHSGSVVVGRIDRMARTDQGIGNAHGVFDSGEYGKEAERLVRGGFIRGVSADLDKFKADEEAQSLGSEEDESLNPSRIKIREARVMAVTLVPKPAFQECTIAIEEDKQEDEMVPDGVYVEGMDPIEASAIVACGMIAGAIPTVPPASWFENPKMSHATPLTVDDEGRVFGHIAAWHVDHIGMAFGTKPPRSRSNYSYFHTGVIRTEDGTDVPVGQLTLAGGHATLEMNAQQAVRHYDDTASAIADVHAGEDAHGIWVAGALRPGSTPEQIRSLRASAPSGDWRPVKGHLELVAVCQVNVPGFPIARSRVASGQVMALVAAGASMLAHMKSDPVADLNARLDRLEQPLVAAADNARMRVMAIKAEELSARVRKAKKDIIRPEASVDRIPKEGILAAGDDPCWEGYEMVGYKEKDGKQVPNCVPIDASASEVDADPLVASLRDRVAIVTSMVSAGGADRNRGNAEKLRRYWVSGEGAAKIRWGTPGDWKRCVRHLSKYMGVRSKGYCQLRHKEATGVYTGSRRNPGRNNSARSLVSGALYGSELSAFTEISEDDLLLTVDQIMAEPDDLFDGNWKPEKAIVVSMRNLDYSDEQDAESSFAAIDPIVEDLTPEEIEALKVEKINRAKNFRVKKKGKYTAETQPRDSAGKFRTVLARLKLDLGVAGLDKAIQEVEKVENLDFSGNYTKAAKASKDLIGIIDRLDTKALNPDSISNIRASSAELGKVIANLPFAFGETAEKIRFSDVPPTLRDLIKDMITKVEAKIGQKDADIATADLKTFMSGGDYFNQSEISSQMSKLLRLLT